MKRYTLDTSAFRPAGLKEDTRGTWVKYKDAVKHGNTRFTEGHEATEVVVKMSSSQVDDLFNNPETEAFLAETTCGRRLYVRQFDEATKAPDDVTPGIHRSVNLEKDDNAVAHGDSRYEDGRQEVTGSVLIPTKHIEDLRDEDKPNRLEVPVIVGSFDDRLVVTLRSNALKESSLASGTQRSVNLEKDSDEDIAKVIYEAQRELKDRGFIVSVTSEKVIYSKGYPSS